MPDRKPQNVFQQIMARETGKPVYKVGIARSYIDPELGRRELHSTRILEELVQSWTYQDLRTNTEDITDRLGNMEIQGSFKKGGMVKKTGVYLLHKGEKVIPANQVKKNKSKYKK